MKFVCVPVGNQLNNYTGKEPNILPFAGHEILIPTKDQSKIKKVVQLYILAICILLQEECECGWNLPDRLTTFIF